LQRLAREDAAVLAPRPWTYAGIVRAPGTVNVIVVPDQGPDVARPEPTTELRRRILDYLDKRRDITSRLVVHGPRYLPVIVKAEIKLWPQAIDAGASAAVVHDETLARIVAFLHPTRGGPDGSGWRVGDHVSTAELFQVIRPTEDLGYLSLLQVQEGVPAYHFPPLGPGGEWKDENGERPQKLRREFGAMARLADYEIVCSAVNDDGSPAHTVDVAPDKDT
jgi:hypothetical protein